jgi:asparagine synthase (glutamine-hydrolysing)
VIHAADEPGAPRPGEPAVDLITEQCAAILRRAVERRISHCEHFPVAVALSGGLDSTIIAGLSSGIPAGKIVAITIGGAPQDEDAMIALRVATGLSIPRRFESVSAESLYSSYPRIVLAFGAQGAAYSAYFLGEAVRRHWTGAKVALCGEGADELFLGYRMHVDAGSYVERAVDALTDVSGDSIEASPLLQLVAGWRSLDAQEIRTQLNRLLRTHQLANRHLIPFDHGMMAHGIECRVPFLDREVALFVGRVPELARTAGNTSKLLLRLVATDLLRPFGLELERLVLDRKPSPLPAAMKAARAALSRRIGNTLAQLDVRRSRLARFANGPEDLFWLGAIGAIFLRQRAQIEDMDLAEMEVEIADVVTH